jgi:hypothetical protein
MGIPAGLTGFGQLPAGMPALAGMPAPAGLSVPHGNPTPAILAPQPITPVAGVKYPKVPDWILYCDRHPDRSGANLSALIPKFQELGYRFISQLCNDRITVNKLSEWLAVGPGTADLIIGFAQEDCQLVVAGKFTMELPSGMVAAAAE